MRGVIVVILDKLAADYSSPLFFNNVECAKRYFFGLKAQAGSNFTDFELYLIANYDTSKGIFEDCCQELLLKGNAIDEVK
ncbi:nonstructural protein [Capybara microvirus Cap3_SP_562]|nr:nonstructural protein [Capybara microvirus Cap3_SP_562]